MIFDPNPLFYQMFAIYKNNKHKPDKVTICNEGSSRCFDSNTKIITKSGNKKISEINKGEFVLTLNELTSANEFKPVNEVLKLNNKKPSYKITLKNGKIIKATQDHEFYYEGSWHSLKHIVTLWNESKI